MLNRAIEQSFYIIVAAAIFTVVFFDQRSSTLIYSLANQAKCVRLLIFVAVAVFARSCDEMKKKSGQFISVFNHKSNKGVV